MSRVAVVTGANRGIGLGVVRELAARGHTVVLGARDRAKGRRRNAVCPDWVATDMGGGGGRSVEQGAAGIVWAALLPGDGPSGGFFRDGRPVDW